MTDNEKDPSEKNPPIALIEEPFGINTLEIREAQDQDEALELDEGLDENTEEKIEEPAAESPEEELPPGELELAEDAGELARVAEAIAEASQQHVIDAQEASQAQTEEAAAHLAAQIAEDEALAEALARQDQEAEEGDPELQAALPKAPVADENGALDLAEMEACIEALLFMTDKPISLKRLQDLLGPDFSAEVFAEATASLSKRYSATCHGIELVEVAGGYQFRTKPGRAALARKLAKVQTQRLSTGAMESLAIVAYRQPVMKEDIDKIRGVDSSYFIRGLLDKKLIKISGRSELPGRPMLYSTTEEFLEVFGLKDLSAMPSLHEIEKMIPASQSGNPEDEDPRVKEMRRLVAQMKSDTSTTLNYNPHEDEQILKDIREKVNSIPTSTPFLEQQKAAEKEAELAAQAAALAAQNAEPQPALPSLEG